MPPSDRRQDRATVALKGAGLVLYAREDGEVPTASRVGAGLYAWDTRHLSRYRIAPRDGRLRLRSTSILPDGVQFEYVLRRDGTEVPVTVARSLRLGASFVDRWTVRNQGARGLAFDLDVHIGADFKDLFEVRRAGRVTRGRAATEASGGSLRFRYTASDGVRHTTDVRAPVDAWRATRGAARGRVRIPLAAGERRSFEVSVQVSSSACPAPRADGRSWTEWRSTSTRFASDSLDLVAWLETSTRDLFHLCDRTADGHFPLAGLPWFAAPFGRDSILTALFALPLRRDLAPAVLRALAAHQGRLDVPNRDEEPGRIPHEIRQGEIVRTGGGFGSPYYGSVDATPLYVWLAAEAARWTPERDLLGELEPALRAAVRWMEERGDLDGDGLIEYRRRAPLGLENQAWKDSHDSLLRRDGRRPDGPIAAVEVQAYAYAALAGLAGAVRARDPEWSAELSAKARSLRVAFEQAFWIPRRGFYAQALDGAKRPIPDVTSNVGHVLWTGIAGAERGHLAALRLRAPDVASGWGIRTRSSRSAHFAPGSYHNGSVWPHDTAIAAAGMRRYGAREGAARTLADLIAAARRFPEHRLPELFGGERRDGDAPPVRYPVACSPQAWTAAAAFLCVRTMLGLEVSTDGTRVTVDPLLPEGVDRFEAIGLRVGTGALDVRITRRRRGAIVSALFARGVSVTVRGGGVLASPRSAGGAADGSDASESRSIVR